MEESINLSLENVPQFFTSEEELLAYVDKLHFFDENLHSKISDLEKVKDTSDAGTIQTIMRFQQELYVVSRLLMIQKWQSIPDDINRNHFYRKITDKKVAYQSEIDEILRLSTYSPVHAISHMTKSEFEIYKNVFNKLFELHQEKEQK